MWIYALDVSKEQHFLIIKFSCIRVAFLQNNKVKTTTLVAICICIMYLQYMTLQVYTWENHDKWN